MRRQSQGRELISLFLEYDWITIEIPKDQFLKKEEMNERPEFYKVRCLLSGPKHKCEQYISNNLDWVIFNEDIITNDFDSDNYEDDTGLPPIPEEEEEK